MNVIISSPSSRFATSCKLRATRPLVLATRHAHVRGTPCRLPASHHQATQHAFFWCPLSRANRLRGEPSLSHFARVVHCHQQPCSHCTAAIAQLAPTPALALHTSPCLSSERTGCLHTTEDRIKTFSQKEVRHQGRTTVIKRTLSKLFCQRCQASGHAHPRRYFAATRARHTALRRPGCQLILASPPLRVPHTWGVLLRPFRSNKKKVVERDSFPGAVCKTRFRLFAPHGQPGVTEHQLHACALQPGKCRPHSRPRTSCICSPRPPFFSTGFRSNFDPRIGNGQPHTHTLFSWAPGSVLCRL